MRPWSILTNQCIMLSLGLYTSMLFAAEYETYTEKRLGTFDAVQYSIDADNRNNIMHMVYSSPDGKLYYTKSLDTGTTWSQSVQVASNIARPKIAGDNNKKAHIVFDHGTSSAGYVSYTTNVSGSFSSPVTIPKAQTDVATDFMHGPSIAADDNDNIHVIFAAAYSGTIDWKLRCRTAYGYKTASAANFTMMDLQYGKDGDGGSSWGKLRRARNGDMHMVYMSRKRTPSTWSFTYINRKKDGTWGEVKTYDGDVECDHHVAIDEGPDGTLHVSGFQATPSIKWLYLNDKGGSFAIKNSFNNNWEPVSNIMVTPANYIFMTEGNRDTDSSRYVIYDPTTENWRSIVWLGNHTCGTRDGQTPIVAWFNNRPRLFYVKDSSQIIMRTFAGNPAPVSATRLQSSAPQRGAILSVRSVENALSITVTPPPVSSVQLSVCGLNGRTILNRAVQSGRLVCNEHITGLSKGIYLIRISAKNKVIDSRIAVVSPSSSGHQYGTGME